MIRWVKGEGRNNFNDCDSQSWYFHTVPKLLLSYYVSMVTKRVYYDSWDSVLYESVVFWGAIIFLWGSGEVITTQGEHDGYTWPAKFPGCNYGYQNAYTQVWLYIMHGSNSGCIPQWLLSCVSFGFCFHKELHIFLLSM